MTNPAETPLPEGALSQKDLRALIIGVFMTHLMPAIKGKTVVTKHVNGHDEDVSFATGTIQNVSLLEEYESDVLFTIDTPGYGSADVCLEELANFLGDGRE